MGLLLAGELRQLVTECPANELLGIPLHHDTGLTGRPMGANSNPVTDVVDQNEWVLGSGVA